MSAASDASENYNNRFDLPNVMRTNLNSDMYRNSGRVLDLDDIFKRVVLNFVSEHKLVITIVFNIFIVLVTTMVLTQVFSKGCQEEPDVTVGEFGEFCTPFAPVDRVVVEIDLDTHSHCYSSKSCVTLGHTLAKERYSFIIGAYGFVYVQLGYQCKLEFSNVPMLKIRLPVDSIYSGHDFMAARKAVEKFTEILREGLDCGMILHNYTMTAEGCGQWNSWCTRILQEFVTEDTPVGVPGPKKEFKVTTTQNALFNPFDISRVYNYHYQLKACGH